jgi:hypothetical protein
MAKTNWHMDLAKLVSEMAPERRQELLNAVAALKAAQQLPPGQTSKDDGIRAWLRQNGPLAYAMQEELKKGRAFGMSEGEREEAGEVISKITAAYQYALGDWSGEVDALAHAEEYIQEAREHPAYKSAFLKFSRRLSEKEDEYVKQANIAQAADANKAKQQAEKAAQEERVKLVSDSKKSFLDNLAYRGGTEEEVMCRLISPAGAQYEASHLTFLSANDTHPIADVISGMDGIDHSVKSCAEFKALNSYLHTELNGVNDVKRVPRGGHTIAYVYKRQVWRTKAACPNCNSWLARLGWTSAPGEY